jgi:hypothetical protein
MWFWIALMAFFLIVFLLTKAVARRQGDLHHVGLQHGYGMSDAGDLDAGSGWGTGGDGGWGAGGDGGGW